MSNETQRWRENRDEIAGLDIYPKDRVSHAADLWTVGDCGYYLRGIHAKRWTPETRELLYAAREAVDALDRAMLVEVDR